MAPVKRIRLSPPERRAQLIELGTKMLATRPLEQISVEEIADEAGVSRGLLFHYFATKQDYHLAIVRQTSQEMLDRTAPDELLEPLEILHGVITSYVDYVTENSGSYVSLLRGTASGDPQMRAVFEGTRSAMVDRTLEQLTKLDVVPSPTIVLAVRGWIAFVEETTISWLRSPDVTRDELIELNVQALPAVALPSDIAVALLGTP